MKSEKLKTPRFASLGLTSRSIRIFLYFSLLTFNFSLLSVIAQDNTLDFAPPPLRTVTKDEKAHLSEVTDVKSHTKLALDLMSARLAEAEKLSAASDFDGMYKELGGFHGLLDNTFAFLATLDSRKGKVLDNYKRLEIGLREFTPRLETIRRELPTRYEDYVHKLIIDVRDSRSRAVEPMFSDSVLPPKKPD